MYLSSEFNVDTAEPTVYLEFPAVDMNILINSCFTFWYGYGNPPGGLKVYLDDDLVWTQLAYQDNKWNKGMIDLRKGKLTNITFYGIIGNDWKGDIAIDDLYIKEGTCKGMMMCIRINNYFSLYYTQICTGFKSELHSIISIIM